MIIYLLYTSKATDKIGDLELSDLLRQSRENNLRDGITGLLLYKNGHFMQLIEGQEKDVLACYARICTDRRHHDILKLVQKPLRTRLFPQWEMAFQNENLVERSDKTGLSSFLSPAYSNHALGSDMNEGIFLLLSFKKQIGQL